MRITVGGLMLAVAAIGVAVGSGVFLAKLNLVGDAFWILMLLGGPVAACALWLAFVVYLVLRKGREIARSRRNDRKE